MANYIPIQTVTIGSGGASAINFIDIPQIYTDLAIKLSSRSANVSNFDNPRFTLNSNASSFTRREIYAESGSTGTETVADRIIGTVPAANATSSTFGSLEVYIPNYTSSNNKTYMVDSVTENNSTTQGIWLLGGIWSNTSPISSISITLNSTSNFVQYSTATLYGIRKY